MTGFDKAPVEPREIRVAARPVTWEVRIGSNVTVTVQMADDIENSDTQKVLRLASGDFSCFKSVYLVVDGQRREITIPVESPTD